MLNKNWEKEALQFLTDLSRACTHGKNMITKLKSGKISQSLFEKYYE